MITIEWVRSGDTALLPQDETYSDDQYLIALERYAELDCHLRVHDLRMMYWEYVSTPMGETVDQVILLQAKNPDVIG